MLARRSRTSDDHRCYKHISEVKMRVCQDFVAVSAEANITLEKPVKLHPFLQKHCKKGGTLLESLSSLRQGHLQSVLEQHISVVLQYIHGLFSVVVDETTDAR